MTIFHARATVVPWTAASILLFYIDFPIRIISKLSGVEAVEIDVIGDNITKLVLKQEGFPKKAFSFHAGSYIWLSCNLRKSASKIGNSATVAVTSETVTSTTSTVAATEVELTNTGKAGYDKAAKSEEESIMDDKMLTEIFSNVKVPGGPPSGLPSWLWFHPITISSYNRDTNEMTLYIKAFGEGNAEWSGQLLSTAKLVKNGTLNKEDIGFHIGGPNGSLMIKDHLESLDHVIMISGGIGVTPFIAVLEDLIMKKFQGKITFYWSTRSVAEIEAFKKYYELCSGNDKFEVNVFYTNKGSNTESGLTADNKGYKIISGKRPDFNDIKVVKGESTGIMSCGPDDLMVAAESFAFDKQKEGYYIIFH